MPVFGYLSLIFLLVICSINASKYFAKPSYEEYCHLREQCAPLCTCKTYENCSLLPMDETVRKTVLFYHNQIRDIQSAGVPPPSGMTMLQYDMQLEDISRCWAARCDSDYSTCFKTPKFRETSQTIGALILEGEETPKVFLWLQIMSHWLSQAEQVTAKFINNLPENEQYERILNFAQLMNDNIVSVGCAWSLLTSENWLIFVCTYGPTGAQPGRPIYKIGHPCSDCPNNYACDYLRPFERLCKPKIETPELTKSVYHPIKEYRIITSTETNKYLPKTVKLSTIPQISSRKNPHLFTVRPIPQVTGKLRDQHDMTSFKSVTSNLEFVTSPFQKEAFTNLYNVEQIPTILPTVSSSLKSSKIQTYVTLKPTLIYPKPQTGTFSISLVTRIPPVEKYSLKSKGSTQLYSPIPTSTSTAVPNIMSLYSQIPWSNFRKRLPTTSTTVRSQSQTLLKVTQKELPAQRKDHVLGSTGMVESDLKLSHTTPNYLTLSRKDLSQNPSVVNPLVWTAASPFFVIPKLHREVQEGVKQTTIKPMPMIKSTKLLNPRLPNTKLHPVNQPQYQSASRKFYPVEVRRYSSTIKPVLKKEGYIGDLQTPHRPPPYRYLQ